MKNAIKYYYNLDLDSIHQKDKIYSFNCKNDSYILINYDMDDVNIENGIANYLLMNGQKTNQIVLNNFNQLVTNINNSKYVLIKILIPLKKITIDDVINFNIYFNNNEIKTSWFDLWTKKIDYLEYRMNQQGLKYKLLRESFSYYIGLAENAIILVKENSANNFTLSHKRISYNDTTYQLYNPLNYTIDCYFRDTCEYFKSAFFNNVDILQPVKEYLNNLNFNDKRMFFARLMFPTYYFDYYEKIIDNEIEEKEINKIISSSDKYELFLREIYFYLENALPEIEWLKKLSNIDNF